MLFPVGLDHARIRRLPWVTILLVALNVLAFVGSAVAGDEGAVGGRSQELFSYWTAHPWLEMPDSLRRWLERTGRPAERFTPPHRPAPAGADVAGQQRELGARAEALFAELEAQPDRRYALVPARGLLQPGWLTHLFVHGDLEHLVGNMLLFLLVVAPFLEDAWGAPFFLALYLAGGLVAGAAQLLPMGDSEIGIIGASGAISACLGAFALRFAHRRVRMAYWFAWVVRGTFLVPAWAYALVFAAMNLLNLSLAGTGGGGVAYAAHVGGFFFGLGVVLVMRATGLEQRLAPEGATRWQGSLGLDRAVEAADAGDEAGARQRFLEVVRADPADPVALLALARMDARRFDAAEATPRVERLVLQRLSAGDEAGARALVAELGHAVRPDLLRPATAYRVAELTSPSEPHRAAALYEAAARGVGALAGKAALRAAQLLAGSRPEAALELARRAAESPEAPPAVAAQAGELARTLAAQVAAADPYAGGIELPGEPPPAPPPRAAPAPVEVVPVAPPLAVPVEAALAAPSLLAPAEPVRLVRCRLAGSDAGGLDLVTAEGRRARVEAARIAAVASGLVPGPAVADGGPARPAVLLDLMLHARPGEARVVLRLPGQALDLARRSPGVPAAEAFALLVGGLLDASGAAAVPGRDAVLGRPFARFADEGAFEAAAWGRRLSPAAPR